MYCKTIFIFVNYTTLASNNSSRFRKNLLERIWKLIMTNDDKVKDEKLKYNINREAVNMSALSSGKIDKYEFLTIEEILSKWNNRTSYKLICSLILL